MAQVSTNPFLNQVSGRLGNVIFVRGTGGRLYMRERVTPKDPRTPAQVAARERLRTVAIAYHSLTSVELAQWATYAKSLWNGISPTKRPASPSPYNEFTALVTKVLQVNPQADIPRTPPTDKFLGDGITLSAAGMSGKVRFTASGPNDPMVMTELLLQPLKSVVVTPQVKGYRSQAFVPFADYPLTYDVTIKKGAYGAAIRFVKFPTGQTSDLVQLGVVTVT
ncbi:MAG: hypothetical protein WCO51_11435 [bacterium]